MEPSTNQTSGDFCYLVHSLLRNEPEIDIREEIKLKRKLVAYLEQMDKVGVQSLEYKNVERKISQALLLLVSGFLLNFWFGDDDAGESSDFCSWGNLGLALLVIGSVQVLWFKLKETLLIARIENKRRVIRRIVFECNAANSFGTMWEQTESEE